MMRVAARALSVFCPHCQKRVTLESLRIVGSHPGRSLVTCGDILVEPSSQLNLEIKANNVVIQGRVRGSVMASGVIEVGATGRVIGDVRAQKVIVRDGGVLQGRCEMTLLPAVDASESDPAGDQQAGGGDSTEENTLTDPIPSRGAAARPSPLPAPPSPEQIRPIRLD
jgi:cytoskeletal protein CcmA (bactofilin family)